MHSAADEIDWSAFFALYRELALRVARALNADEAAAEDVVQEAARALIEKASSSEQPFESRAHARNWYLRCVRNLAVSGLRRRGRAREELLAPDAGAGAEAANRDDPALLASELELAAAQEELAERVDVLMDSLPTGQREALHLRFGDGLSYREISSRTGKAISTLQARVEAGLDKIRKALGKTAGEA